MNKQLLIKDINEYIYQATAESKPNHIYAGDAILELLQPDEETELVDGIKLTIRGYANDPYSRHISIQDEHDERILAAVFDLEHYK